MGALIVAVISLVAVLVACALLAAGYRVGRIVTDNEGIQLRVTNSELMESRRSLHRQLDAAAEALGRVISDPRTMPHDRLALEEIVAPTLVKRER